ncbi:capsid protein precursor [Equine adenovirus 1]|uniref:Pre-protein VI n=1 Tax=Equine adenovirus A serotype 1 TaxID=46916 RepID=G5CZ85_ADEE1|nr:capsid protein precursor [Equine adenovirus 1]AEP16416.1 capsid protein precursor [Equine adenovirus 1]ANG08562.1 capsid protein precursor [Equine adenovirus 1]
MDAVNFSVLAPRFGGNPMMSEWAGIGTSNMNGGAFNWGGIWSGIRNFGHNVVTWGKAGWNSQTGRLLRQRLNDSGIREKVVEGLASGIHGVLDIANQEIARQVEKRLERREPLEVVVPEVRPSPAPSLVIDSGKKRPRDEEVFTLTHSEPPSYSEALQAAAPLVPAPVATAAAAVPVDSHTMADDLPPPYSAIARPVMDPTPVAPVVVAERPVYRPSSSRARGWQGTLANIVGVGLHGVKRRRCFY